METSYTPPVTGITQNRTQLFLILGLVVALCIGFIAVFQAIRLQNRASEVALPGMCKEVFGICSLDPNTTPQAFINDFVANGGKLIVRTQDKNEDVPTTPLSATSVRFRAISGVSYLCRIKKSDGSDFEGVCASPAVGSGTCPATTPVISTPSPSPTNTPSPTMTQACETCGRPGFSCGVPRDVLPGDSCPAKAVYDVAYRQPSLACTTANPLQYPALSCDPAIHQVVIRPMPIGSGTDRPLSKPECEALQRGDFDLELSMGKRGPGCQTYKIVVLDPKTDKEIPGFEICDKCELQSGCPASCPATTEVALQEAMIDVPDLKANGFECPANLCKLTVVDAQNTACQIFNTENTFRVEGQGGINSARIYLDDEYNGNTWINVPLVGGTGTIKHTFKNSGYYDVVVECNYGPQHYYCAQRVTRMCTETNNKCIQIAPPKLDLGECQDCAPTRSPCDPTKPNDPNCSAPTNPPSN